MTARWYIVQTHTAFEKKVAQTIRDQARLHHLEDQFEEVLVPTEEVVEVRPGGKKVSSERKFFPGYVLVKMEMTNESYHLVKDVPKVTGFLARPTSRRRFPSARPSRSFSRSRKVSSVRAPASSSRWARRFASPTVRSNPSPAWWRRWTRTAAA